MLTERPHICWDTRRQWDSQLKSPFSYPSMVQVILRMSNITVQSWKNTTVQVLKREIRLIGALRQCVDKPSLICLQQQKTTKPRPITSLKSCIAASTKHSIEKFCEEMFTFQPSNAHENARTRYSLSRSWLHLVCSLFSKFQMSFLPNDHMDESIKQRFSFISKRFFTKNANTLPELQAHRS